MTHSNIVYGGFWRRFVAFILDGIILILPVAVVSSAFPFVGGIIVSILYYPIFCASSLQATPGKALMGLKITKENGNKLSFKDAFVRYFSSYISTVILSLGYIFCLFNDKKQNLHDMIAETVVIYEPHDDINYIQSYISSFKKLIALLSGENTVDVSSTAPHSQETTIVNTTTPVQSSTISSEIATPTTEISTQHLSVFDPQSSYQTSQDPVEITETVVQKEDSHHDLNNNYVKTASNEASEISTKLDELKKLLDAGLITQADYDLKKQELLSRI